MPLSNIPEIDQQAHRKLAVDLFNNTWSLLDKPDRSEADDLEMIHMAHASRWHWGQVGTAENLSVGEWQVSRVYAVLGQADRATYHGARALEYASSEGLPLYVPAYAHEALARGYALAGQYDRSQEHVAAAREIMTRETDDETRQMVAADLATIPSA
jgi:hypothetical protein